jgi:hypothetical protein
MDDWHGGGWVEASRGGGPSGEEIAWAARLMDACDRGGGSAWAARMAAGQGGVSPESEYSATLEQWHVGWRPMQACAALGGAGLLAVGSLAEVVLEEARHPAGAGPGLMPWAVCLVAAGLGAEMASGPCMGPQARQAGSVLTMVAMAVGLAEEGLDDEAAGWMVGVLKAMGLPIESAERWDEAQTGQGAPGRLGALAEVAEAVVAAWTRQELAMGVEAPAKTRARSL